MTFLGLRLPVFCLFFLGVPLLWLIWIGIYAISPGPSPSAKQIEVVIPSRTSLSAIEKILARDKVIHDDPRFSMLALLTGTASKLRAGEYVFTPGSKPLAVIDLLKKGKVLYRPVTIPEGTEMERVAEILETGGWIDSQQFHVLAQDTEFFGELGILADSLEGYLFPDTYYLSRGQQGEEEIISMMVARHYEIYNDILEKTGIKGPGLTHHEIITLASIVEKETGLPEERALVSSVFMNRLHKGMRLQADPTVRYGQVENSAPLTQNDLNMHTPYNTYIIKGLPPGPITNPGRGAIEAAISPAKTEFLYFVAKDDTSHHFSKTLQEHNRAVTRYRSK